jgi:hypothetical protein
VGFTRADEILNGAPVFDKENEKHGVSKIAGTQGKVFGYFGGLCVSCAVCRVPFGFTIEFQALCIFN